MNEMWIYEEHAKKESKFITFIHFLKWEAMSTAIFLIEYFFSLSLPIKNGPRHSRGTSLNSLFWNSSLPISY